MPSVFISYKRAHDASDEVVRALEAELQSDFDILRDAAMQPGTPWSKELYTFLLECDIGIAIVSHEANVSDWCRREWSVLAARARVSGLRVIPIWIGEHTTTTGILDDWQGIKWPSERAKLSTLLEGFAKQTFSAKDFLAAHQAWLRWQYNDEPVLGQEPYALADVYIETECGLQLWQDINLPPLGQKPDPFCAAVGGRHDLVAATLQQMADPSLREAIVIQAGPGSGKSAFTLRIANELLDRGFTPIVVRFRDLRLATFSSVNEVIDDAIRIGHAADESPNAPGPIVADLLAEERELNGLRICRTVFILDGWDEVSLTGNVSYQAQLKEWLPRLREYFVLRRGSICRLLLTGRPSAEVGDSGVLQRATPVLTMRPIRPDQLEQYVRRVHQQLLKSSDRAWAIDLERVTPIFATYAAWFSGYIEGKESTQSSQGDVLGNPLLAYLSLRVIAASTRDARDLLADPTALYHELIEATVSHAGKGRDENLQAAVHRGGAGLRCLLQEVASTITILRTESVSYSELQARFEDRDLPVPRTNLADWSNVGDTKSVLRELVVNFYFKGGHKDLGCEFLHKSFREYLFAEALFEALREAATPERPGAYDSLEYWEDLPEGSAAHRLSRRLAYLLAPQWLSREVELHLAWLIRNGVGKSVGDWQRVRTLLTEVYAWWAEGVHLRHQPRRSRSSGGGWLAPFVDQLFRQTVPLAPDSEVKPVRTTVLDAHLGHALIRIACTLYAVVPAGEARESGRAAVYSSRIQGRLRFKPGRDGFMNAIMARINSEGWRPGMGLDEFVFGAVDLSNERLSGIGGLRQNLRGAALSGADLSEATLLCADLSGADLSHANLSHANLFSADLSGADLSGSNLSRANLSFAILSEAKLLGADLLGANLFSANLSCADLSRANLLGTNLDEIEIVNANLSGAQLSREAFGRLTSTSRIHGRPTIADSNDELDDRAQ